MSQETTYISFTHDELMRFADEAAKRAVDRAMDEMRESFQSLFTSLQLVKGIVSREDLALMFNKDQRTIMRWADRHDFERVDGPDRRKVYYDIEDIKRRVRDGKAPKTD
jgi:hypothetical protein